MCVEVGDINVICLSQINILNIFKEFINFSTTYPNIVHASQLGNCRFRTIIFMTPNIKYALTQFERLKYNEMLVGNTTKTNYIIIEPNV